MPKRKKTEGRNSVDLATDFYSNPNANLVSFERKSKPTDYEFESAEIYVQQAMRKSIKRGENELLDLYERKQPGGELSAGRCKPAPEGGGAVDCGYGSTYGRTKADLPKKGDPDRSLKTINKDLDVDIKRATARAKSVFKHWKDMGYIEKGKELKSLPLDERALVIDLSFQLPTEAFKKYKKFAKSLSFGASPDKKNLIKESEVSWKDPKLKKKKKVKDQYRKDERRNEIRKDIYAKFSYTN